MSFFTALYNLLIGPLELFFEVLFGVFNRIFNNPGISVVSLSIVMNFFLLPLYRRVDIIQFEQQKTEKRLSEGVKHIKKTFKGDERFMMLQTYYRQNHYKQTSSLKGLLPLLIEVPFFIAAYNMLSKLELIKGLSFGFIKDLGAPDASLIVGGIAVNILPVLMTAINIVSGIIYTKGFSLSSKIQLYGTAGLFLILLYDSPSGLVIYWTVNNLFTLAKTLFYKVKHPETILSFLASAAGAFGILFLNFIRPINRTDTRNMILLNFLLLFFQFPLVRHFFKRCFDDKKHRFLRAGFLLGDGRSEKIFFYAALFLLFLTGLLIPSSVIKASPLEFVSSVALKSPLVYLLNCFLLSAGTFGIWFSIFYLLSDTKGKRMMGLMTLLIAGIAITDYMFFGKNYGILSPGLEFYSHLFYPFSVIVINLLVLSVISIFLIVMYRWKKENLKILFSASMIAMAVISFINIAVIYSQTNLKVRENMEKNLSEIPEITFSRNGKNVVVLMMDRAISSYLPYIFNEKPELREQFAGFTYYPNTISFGPATTAGAPALFGGYEYTPERINERSEESLKDKHNEMVKVLPSIFASNNFNVTLCDPLSYNYVQDLSIYDGIPNTKVYIINGERWENVSSEEKQEHIWMRNFFCYSIFKISPVVLQPVIYAGGTYIDPKLFSGTLQLKIGVSKGAGLTLRFMEEYNVLAHLKEFFRIEEKVSDNLLIMVNNTTHEPMLLKEPEYIPSEVVDNTGYDAAHKDRFILDGRVMKADNYEQMSHYHSNMAAYIQLGKWFDFLRSEGVWDNTRIIIVADHGRTLKQFDDLFIDGPFEFDIMALNPLLLYKDFNGREFKTDTSFMTNGDVPVLALDGIVEDPVNPFTKNKISSDLKHTGEQHVIYGHYKNNEKKFSADSWYCLKGEDIWDKASWSKMTSYDLN